MGRSARRPDLTRGPATPATLLLDRSGVPYRSHTYVHDDSAQSYGLEAAAALGVEPGRVFKTLLVDTSRGLAVGVVPVSGQLDLRAIARALDVKNADLAAPAAAQRSSGYVVGGISPLGQKRALPTVVDESALQHETVYVSGGRRGFDIELEPGRLVELTQACVAAIGRG